MSFLSNLFGKKSNLQVDEKMIHKNSVVVYDGEEIELDDEDVENLRVYEENKDGDAKAQYFAGKALFDYANGNYFAIERGEEALELLKNAADGGIAEANKLIGDYYLTKRYGKEDYATALEWYKKGAELGDPEAYWKVGNVYQNGNGVEKNPYEAFGYYLKGAEMGEPCSMSKVGIAYYEGKILEQDKEKAFPFLKGAYEQGEKRFYCGYYLALCYFKGECVEKNPEKCVEILEDLCFSKGLFEDEEAELLLYCYENGVGTSVNYDAANRLRAKMKEQDDMFSLLLDE